MKKIKKRGAVYGVIALLLCAAVYLNWSYVDAPEELLVAGQTGADTTGADTGAAAGTEGEDYFATSRLTREQARDEAVSTLRELSESEDADQAAKDEVAAQISALADDSVAEANIESLIRAKGLSLIHIWQRWHRVMWRAHPGQSARAAADRTHRPGFFPRQGRRRFCRRPRNPPAPAGWSESGTAIYRAERSRLQSR